MITITEDELKGMVSVLLDTPARYSKDLLTFLENKHSEFIKKTEVEKDVKSGISGDDKATKKA